MSNNMHFALINGPNLNTLGIRETNIYGNISLNDVIKKLKIQARLLKIKLSTFQSNSEGKLISYIHTLIKTKTNIILINPASFTHTSIGIRDALLAVNIPFIEIHISNIYSRDSFRKTSYFSDISIGIICGFGVYSYILALKAAQQYLSINKKY
ncbi:MAG: type II 3-dehydroquinate dehydratase [Enterobacterales bacterium]